MTYYDMLECVKTVERISMREGAVCKQVSHDSQSE